MNPWVAKLGLKPLPKSNYSYDKLTEEQKQKLGSDRPIHPRYVGNMDESTQIAMGKHLLSMNAKLHAMTGYQQQQPPSDPVVCADSDDMECHETLDDEQPVKASSRAKKDKKVSKVKKAAKPKPPKGKKPVKKPAKKKV